MSAYDQYSKWSGALDMLTDANDKPMCDPPDDCTVCVLLTEPLAGESRVQWAKRVLGATAMESVA